MNVYEARGGFEALTINSKFQSKGWGQIGNEVKVAHGMTELMTH